MVRRFSKFDYEGRQAMGYKRLDAKTPRKYTDKTGAEKTAWTKMGVAFVPDDGHGHIRIQLDGFPVNGELVLMEPYDNDAPRGGGGGGGGPPRPGNRYRGQGQPQRGGFTPPQRPAAPPAPAPAYPSEWDDPPAGGGGGFDDE